MEKYNKSQIIYDILEVKSKNVYHRVIIVIIE
jgi:hypothetical protein